MFKAAALTRQYDIEHSGHFDPARDKVVVLEVQDVSEIETKVEDATATYSGTYGATVEFGVWSHSGLDGPIGSTSTSSNPLYEGSTQMNMTGWGEIDFNWDASGSCRAGFYGCNSGNDSRGANQSFTTQLSGLANFKDVSLLGQTTSSYPSKYTNTRSLANYQLFGNYLPVERSETHYLGVDGPITLQWTNKTYMVGGDSGKSAGAYFGGTNANSMRLSRNGASVKTGVYQAGDKDD